MHKIDPSTYKDDGELSGSGMAILKETYRIITRQEQEAARRDIADEI